MIHADEMATVWVVRAGPKDRLVRTFLDEGEIGVAFPQFPDGPDVDRSKALKILGVGLDDEPSKHQDADAALLLSFVRRIRDADLALLLDPVAGGSAGVVATRSDERPDVATGKAVGGRRDLGWR